MKWKESDSVGATMCPSLCLDYPESRVCFSVLNVIIIAAVPLDTTDDPRVRGSRTFIMGRRVSSWGILL